jgi:polysaccharide biosynthesis/export protein
VTSSLLLLASAFAQEDREYTFGPEDVITVTVLRHPEFSGDLLVTDSGYIQVPVVGSVKAEGATVSQLTALLVKKFRVRLLKPEVTVTLKIARQNRLFVLGDVQKPGIFNWRPGYRVSQAIAAASGLIPGLEKEDFRVILERDGVPDLNLSLAEALSEARTKDLTLRPGDVLRVESIALRSVYVAGKVKLPGVYRLRDDSRTVLGAIALAGGTLDEAALEKVKILRANGSIEEVNLAPTLVDGALVKTPTLETGDTVVVPEQTNRFVVLGYVTKPGYYPMPSGREIRLADAIATAQGGTSRGRFSRVGLITYRSGKEERVVYDLGRFLMRGDVTQNPKLVSGDIVFVPETDRIELATVLGALSSTSLLLNAIKR